MIRGMAAGLRVVFAMLLVVVVGGDRVLAQEASISGYVYREDGVTPVEGACFRVHPDDPSASGWPHCLSGPDGNFSIPGLSPGTYYLRTDADDQGYNPHLVDEWYTPDGGTQDPALAAPIEVVAGSTTSGIVFTLKEAGAISGHVYREDGVTPVEGACFRVHPDDPSAYGQPYCLSGADGVFTIPAVYSGTYYLRTDANDQGYNPHLVDEWYTPDGGTQDPALAAPIEVVTGSTTSGIVFTLKEAGAISGHVYREDGVTPVEDACFRVHLDDPSAYGQPYCLSDADGAFTIPGVYSGTYYLRTDANDQGYNPHLIDEWYTPDGGTQDPALAAPIEVVTGSTTSGIDFTLGSWCIVDSTADSGPGTLRQCLTLAESGDAIAFDTDAFPPASPATIALASGLPEITQGNLTIDASDAGVILDGSGVGATPETLLLDDVSLTLDGGPDLIANADFSAGLGHWRPWDDRPGATRSVNTTEFHSSPNSYQWDVVADARDSRTVYDTANTSDPTDDPFGDSDSTAWIPATGGSTVELRFWYRYGPLGATLYALFPDDVDDIGEWSFNAQPDWTERVVNQTLPGDAIGVGIAFQYAHSERWTEGLRISSSGNAVQGLQIVNFPDHGIVLRGGAQNNVIGGDSTVGAAALGEGNLISGNGGDGVQISGTGAMSNAVSGNHIGTDVSGAATLGNDGAGVYIADGASHSVIGGVNGSPGAGCTVECNLISGNGWDGVAIRDSGTMHNTVSGNYIGVDGSGTVGMGNGATEDGVGIRFGPSHNTIGGDTPGERNVISGHGDDGVKLDGASDNLVIGNYIGTDAGGAASIPNGEGVNIGGGASNNRIGGDTGNERNLISGNEGTGVIIGEGGSSNTVSGNYIGTNATAAAAVPNLHGVELESGAGGYNVIGGDAAGEGNVISGNTWWGLVLANTSHTRIVGNLVGAIGSVTVSNGESGIGIWYDSPDTEIRGNRIGGHQAQGIYLTGSLDTPLDARVVDNTLTGNGDGIAIRADGVWVAENTISENRVAGIRVQRDEWFDSIENTLARNSIYDNGYLGIDLVNGANAGIAAPVIVSADVATGLANGTACAGCRVEIFSDDEEEGRWYEGFVTAGATGDWSFNKGSAFTGPNVHATATDAAGNTSEFSRPMRDVAVVGAVPSGEVHVGEPTSVRAELRNHGSQPEDGVPVRCSIQGTAYDETENSGDIEPGAWCLVEFPDWTPSAADVYTLVCESLLDDENPGNDVFTRLITATVTGPPDVWTRDNPQDTGEVPSAHPWWVSPDIWVRHDADGGLVHQNPIAFQENTVYVRLRNRGGSPASGEVQVFWDRSRIGWPCKVSQPNVGTIPFEDLAPGEVRIVSLGWTPQEVGRHGLHTVIEAEGDPADRSAPCSPHRPRWDNNVSWHNVIVYFHPPTGAQSIRSTEEVAVDLVNVYDWPKDVDLIVGRGDFPATGAISLRLDEGLFDRWWSYGGSWDEGVTVNATTKVISVVDPISATVGGLPLEAGEEATATLLFDAPDAGAFEARVYERIDGLVVGGITYRWIESDVTPPAVAATSPADGAVEVGLTAPVVITFTEEIGPLSLDLMVAPDPDGWHLTWNEGGTVLKATHTEFAPLTTYTVTVTAGDAFANAMETPYVWTFTTEEHEVYMPLVFRQ